MSWFPQRLAKQTVRFCRSKLGLKPVIDYAQSRIRLLGVSDLPIRTVFDIGANRGRKARLYRRRFPDARIYCVEPIPACCAIIEEWAQHQHGLVSVMNLALGSQPGKLNFCWNVRHSGGSSLIEPHDIESRLRRGDCRRIEVAVETLDRVASRLPVEDGILVKIDVEGFDLEVIRGGRATLRRASAVIVEVGLTDHSVRPPFADFVNELADLDYAFRGYLGCAWVDGIPHLADAVFTKSAVSNGTQAAA